MKWEWESYVPGPEVYDQLWRIRKEPATVTPSLPHECPIPNARTRILDRRQTEGDIQTNFYVVEITQSIQGSFTRNTNSVDSRTEAVDLSCILQYVSPHELEVYENEQFSIEAEAEAIAMRAESAELARKRLEKNARITGVSEGSRMLSGLNLNTDVSVQTRGRPRGSRGRGRGRGRGTWRGRSNIVLSSRLHDGDMEEDLVDIDDGGALRREDEGIQRIIAETESEEEELHNDVRMHSSPGLMRSAFIANSALPVSPVNRRLSTSLGGRQVNAESSVVEDSDDDLVDYEAHSLSSAAGQLRFGDAVRNGTIEESSSDNQNRYCRKRRRTGSPGSSQQLPTTRQGSESELERPYPQTLLFRGSSVPDADSISEPESPHPQTLMFRNESSLPEYSSDASGEAIPAQPPPSSHRSLQNSRYRAPDDNDHNHIPTSNNVHPDHGRASGTGDDSDGDDGAEEYVVESIIEHYHEGGKTYYLVKREGFEDSHDWLPESDLEGAAEVVAAYNKRIERKADKHRVE